MQQKFTSKSIFFTSFKIVVLTLIFTVIAQSPFAQNRGVSSTEIIPTGNDAGIQNKQTNENNQAHRNEAICATFSGTLEAGDLTLGTGRMFREGVASTCAAPKTCPGPTGPTGNWYDTYTFTNPASTPQCIIVTFTNTSTIANANFVSAHLGTFSPSNICDNYIADQGTSAAAGLSNSFSFTLAGSATVVLAVTSITVGIGGSYLMTVDAPNCSSVPCAGSPSPGNTIASPNTVCPGINFTLSLQNNPQVGGITYQWQKASASTGPWTDSTGATNFALTVTQGESATWWRSVVTCATSSLSTNSNPVLVGNGRGVFTTHPANATVRCESTASFSAAATGYLLTWTWQYRESSSSSFWFDVPNSGVYTGTTTSTLTLTNMPQTMNGYQYRALMRGFCTAVDFSNPATLTLTPITATVSPTSAIICTGTVQLLSLTNSVSAPTTEIFNATTGLPANVPDNDLNGIASDLTVAGIPAGSVITNVSVKFNMTHTWVGDMIMNLKAPNGQTINLFALLDNFTGGNGTADFVNTTFDSLSTLAISGAPAPRTNTFRAEHRTFTPNVPGVTPRTAVSWSPLLGTPNGTWTLGMCDAGPGDLGILTSWSVSITYTAPNFAQGTWTSNPSTPNTMFTDAAATIPYTGTLATSIYVKPTVNTVYSVSFTSPTPCTSSPTNIPVNVVNPVSAVVNPTDKSVCIGGNTSFSVSASGGPITYQWQLSTNGGTSYSNIAGATTTTLNLTNVTMAMSTYRYRAYLKALPCIGTDTTLAAILTVNPLPVITISAAPYTALRPQLTTTIKAASTPRGASYLWTFNGATLTGATDSFVVANVDGIGTYKVRVTDVNGCINTSSSITITDLFDDRIFIYPNPAPDGQFQVRLYSGINFDYRHINIYNSIGQRVYRKPIATSAPWQRIDVNLTGIPSGVYVVEVTDEYDTKRAVERFIIQR